MVFTHIFDFFLKIILLFTTIFIVVNIPYFAQQDDGVEALITILLVCIILYLSFLRSLGTYLYCRFNLKIPVKFREAKRLNEALAPNPFTSRTWLPLKEVLPLENELKYDSALQLLENWKKEKSLKHQKAIQQFKDNPKQTKTFEVIIIILAGISFVTSFLNLPPASYLISLYCNIFETEKYYPMLIGAIMTLFISIVGLFIKKIFRL